MTDALNSLKVGQMVSREGELERYELEDADAITVAVYHAKDLLRSIRIGKEADKGSGCYITLAGREGIYLVEGALRSIFDVSLDELRNRQIFSFTSSDIISVGVTSAEARFSLRKAGRNRRHGNFRKRSRNALIKTRSPILSPSLQESMQPPFSLPTPSEVKRKPPGVLPFRVKRRSIASGSTEKWRVTTMHTAVWPIQIRNLSA